MADLTPVNLYIGMIITGFFTGMGVATGAFLANKYFLKQSAKLVHGLEEKIKNLHSKTEKIAKVKK